MPAYSFNTQYSANKGSVLAISLVILTAITLVSITAMQRSGLQGKMVGNVQHKEKAFHAANSELEQIYEFYLTQEFASVALANPIMSHDIVNGEKVYTPVETGHTSPYSNYTPPHGSSYVAPKLQVISNIISEAPGIPEGFSYGSFESYNLVITTSSSRPNRGSNSGALLSSQSIGVTFVAPKIVGS